MNEESLSRHGIEKRLLANSTFIAASRFARAFHPIILTPLFINAWGNERFGEWLAISALPAGLMILQDGGVSTAIANEMGAMSREDDKKARELQNLAVWSCLIACLFLSFAATLVYCFYLQQRIGQHFSDEEVRLTFTLQMAAIFFNLHTTGLVGSFRYAGRENAFIGYATLFNMLEVAVMSCILLTVSSPVLLSFCVVCLKGLHYYLIHREAIFILGKSSAFTHTPSWKSFKPYFYKSSGFALLPLIVSIQNQGIFLLVYSIASSSAASFQTVRTYANSMQLLTGVFYSASLPELPKLWGERDFSKIRQIYVSLITITFLLCIIVAFLMIFFGPSVFKVWTNSKIHFPYDLGVALIVLAFMTSMLNCCMAVPKATNMVYRLSFVFLIMNCIGFGFCYLFASWLGVLGICSIMIAVELLSAYAAFVFAWMLTTTKSSP